ncbi:MAG: hypothetical protein F2839_06215 [Actinobacteria bacterium]|uniref:Unannotated protein n=1 Tax=freshwater metagenome TaxID=449393 RepID=A0A6J5ZPH7_9ZZZZ|nr:hypothetical protein [Actinomycetota bacterium]
MSAVWEFKEIRLSHDVSRNAVREILTSMAEIERWELERVRVYPDGRRWIRLRRKIYHLERTA